MGIEEYIFNANNEFRQYFQLWKIYINDLYIYGMGDLRPLTIESEKDGISPFLDISIQRCPDKFSTKDCRKDTHTTLHSLDFLKGLIHRAHLYCDLKEELLDEWIYFKLFLFQMDIQGI